MEEWKDIKGYEGLYQVSNEGRVKSLSRNCFVKDKLGNKYCRTIKEKILKPIKQSNGYLYNTLHKNGEGKMFRTHRLVAEAFIPNSNSLLIINHKDEDKENNSVSNLEWCTPKYNSNYGNSIAKRVTKQAKQVYQYDLDGNLVKVWESTMECGRNGYGQSKIVMCCNGKRKTHKGYIWSFEYLNPEHQIREEYRQYQAQSFDITEL